MGQDKHTPGPWEITRDQRIDNLGNKSPCVFVDGGPILPKHFDPKSDYAGDFIHRVCELFSPWVSEDTPQAEQSRQASIMDANAHLIAAAPDMLAALRQAESVIRWAAQEAEGRVKAQVVGGWLFHADECRATIAKAEGNA